MGPRSGLDGRKISFPPGFDPGHIYIIQDIRKSLYAFVDFNTMWNDIKNFTHLKTTGRILSIR